MSSGTPKVQRDPFLGLQPSAVRCRWLPGDEKKATSARVFRLVVDDATYQRSFFSDVGEWLAGEAASSPRLVIAPAGCITFELDAPLPASVGEYSILDAAVGVAVNAAQWRGSNVDFVVGVDGCLRGTGLPFQCALRISPSDTVSRSRSVPKLYPAEVEERLLWGWLVVRAHGQVPPELRAVRLLQTKAGNVLPLICHEAVAFSGRSQSKLRHQDRVACREHFAAVLRAGSVNLVAMCIHHARPGHGGIFLNAAAEIHRASGGLPVIPSMFAPRDELERQARRFCVWPKDDPSIATVLVETV